MKRSSEAFWWSLFSAGGVMSALFMPVLIVTTGMILPFMAGDDAAGSFEQLQRVTSFWLFRIVLFGIVLLSCFHCAHRIRHILIDLGLRNAAPILSLGCYGGAVVGALVAGLLLVRL
ncbi:MAG: fumarate reductase subunit FrdD [Planctomycetota bacterium]|jgi:fumarate reductase subunit D